MVTDALTVANYFIQKGVKSNKPITQVQLQKLVYIAHGWHLALEKGPLFNDQVCAWKYGPVIPVLHKVFKGFGSSNIEFTTDFADLSPNNEETKELLNVVWETYGSMPASKLIALTHKEGTPWHKVYQPNFMDTVIPNESIKQHYVSLKDKIQNINTESVR
jgi:uncharacterized phage-associated protein